MNGKDDNIDDEFTQKKIAELYCQSYGQSMEILFLYFAFGGNESVKDITNKINEWIKGQPLRMIINEKIELYFKIQTLCNIIPPKVYKDSTNNCNNLSDCKSNIIIINKIYDRIFSEIELLKNDNKNKMENKENQSNPQKQSISFNLQYVYGLITNFKNSIKDLMEKSRMDPKSKENLDLFDSYLGLLKKQIEKIEKIKKGYAPSEIHSVFQRLKEKKQTDSSNSWYDVLSKHNQIYNIKKDKLLEYIKGHYSTLHRTYWNSEDERGHHFEDLELNFKKFKREEVLFNSKIITAQTGYLEIYRAMIDNKATEKPLRVLINEANMLIIKNVVDRLKFTEDFKFEYILPRFARSPGNRENVLNTNSWDAYVEEKRIERKIANHVPISLILNDVEALLCFPFNYGECDVTTAFYTTNENILEICNEYWTMKWNNSNIWNNSKYNDKYFRLYDVPKKT